jgi:hypothetical protein
VIVVSAAVLLVITRPVVFFEIRDELASLDVVELADTDPVVDA